MASEQTEGLTLLAPLAGLLQQPVGTSALALPPHPWRAVSADPSFSSSAAACPLHGGVEDRGTRWVLSMLPAARS